MTPSSKAFLSDKIQNRYKNKLKPKYSTHTPFVIQIKTCTSNTRKTCRSILPSQLFSINSDFKSTIYTRSLYLKLWNHVQTADLYTSNLPITSFLYFTLFCCWSLTWSSYYSVYFSPTTTVMFPVTTWIGHDHDKVKSLPRPSILVNAWLTLHCWENSLDRHFTYLLTITILLTIFFHTGLVYSLDSCKFWSPLLRSIFLLQLRMCSFLSPLIIKSPKTLPFVILFSCP